MTVFSDQDTGISDQAVLLAEDDPEFIAIAEQFGGVAALNERMERSERAFRRLYREMDALFEQYPDQWVAMDEDGLVAVADSHDNLLKALAAQGRYAGDLATKHLDTQPDEWLVL